ncbi:acetate--CoA ligase family protein [Nonomuraea sp. NPDC050691]|uniref:acetate--CoA ligase family protein n=1 Tax=Nonomuraea sp. NPDC050691 TaxID=3155661 RepID=UPI003409C288
MASGPVPEAVFEHEAKALLREAGVPVPRGVVIMEPGSGSEGSGFGAIAGLPEPVVLKAFGPGLVHKSDSGAVRLGLRLAEVEGAAGRMREALSARGITPAGFLVEEQAEAGVELIAGLVRDPGFGPVLLAGLGGVWAEALRDTALALCPVSEDDVHRMLASLRGSALLHGYRGRPGVDVGAVVKLLMTLGGPGGLWERLELGEFEANPVIAAPSGVVAVDARYLPLASPPEDATRTTTPSAHPTAQEDRLPTTPPPERTAQTAPLPTTHPPEREAEGDVGDFRELFEPRSVAVVGASTTRPTFGNMFLEFYRAAGMPVVAVHPEAAEVAGVPAVRSLAEAGVDYALVAVPAERCADVVRQATGVPYTQVMSGGFGEAGRPELEAGLVEAARGAGTRLLGPNCMGVYCPRGRQTFTGGGLGPSGTIALISQSGGLAGEVIKVGERRGLAFSRVATVGNAADVTPAELLRWLSHDPETRAVGLYLEDPREGRALYEALAATTLPVALLVGGRSAQGRRAAASHTGGLVGDGRIWRALAEQTGATLVGSQDDLIGVLSFFQAHGTRPATGEGVLVIGPSGGAGVLAADAFDGAGVRLEPLPGEALAGLRGLGLGAGSTLANPLEVPVGPRSRPGLVRSAVAAILRHRPYRDVVAHVNVQSFFTYGTAAEPLLEYARALGEAQEELAGTRFTLVTRNGECAPAGVEDEVRGIAARAGIPVYRSMEAAAVAVASGRTLDGCLASERRPAHGRPPEGARHPKESRTSKDGGPLKGRTADNRPPDGRIPDSRSPDGRIPDGRSSGRTSDGRTSDGRTSDARTSDGRTSDDRTSEDGPPPEGRRVGRAGS